MKFKLFFTIGAFSVLSVLLITACKGCKENCPDGYDSKKGDCICPDDNFEAWGECRPLKPNEYYGMKTDCICRDSGFFVIGEPYMIPESNNVFIELDKIVSYGKENAVFIYTNVNGVEYFRGGNGVGDCTKDWTEEWDIKIEGTRTHPDTLLLTEYRTKLYVSNLRDTCHWILYK
jgi:hypothetical protein